MIYPQPFFEAFVKVFSLTFSVPCISTTSHIARQQNMELREKQQEKHELRQVRSSKPPPSVKGIQQQEMARDELQKSDRNVERTQLLSLALDWDCIDVARELILKNSLDNIIVCIISSRISNLSSLI